MQKKVVGLAVLSVFTIAINGLPLVPIGFLIALPLVARSRGVGNLWTGLVDNWQKVLTLLGGLAIGVLVLQASCNVQVSNSGFGFGLYGRVLPVRDWLSSSGTGDAAGFYNQGQVLKSRGRCDQALAYYRRAAELAPDDPDPWHQICACHLMQLDDPAMGRQACLRAHRLGPDQAEPCYKLAIAHLLLEEFAPAAQWARKTLERAPARTDATNVLALALLHQGKREEAGALLEKLVETEPDKALFRKNYALWLAEEKQCDRARTQLDKAAELGADTAGARESLDQTCPPPPSASGTTGRRKPPGSPGP